MKILDILSICIQWKVVYKENKLLFSLAGKIKSSYCDMFTGVLV